MAATGWGTDSTQDFLITGDAGDQFDPIVADSGGGSFGVGWISSVGVTLRFYDVVGALDPLLGTITVSDNVYGDTADAAVESNLAMTAGGSTIGYAVTWEETSATDPNADSILRGRYVGPSGTVGGEFSIDAQAGVDQHDASMSGYGIDDANGRPIVDGFNVVWVSTSSTVDPGTGLSDQGLTQAEIDAGYGQIMLQRFAVELDARKDPVGPPQAAGLDGVVGGDTDTATNIASAIGRDPSTIVTHDGETVVSWIDTNNQLHLRVFDLNGNDISAGVTGANLDDIDGANAGVTVGREARLVDLAGAGFVLAWMGEATINLGGSILTFPAINARVFSVGAAPGTYTASAEFPLAFSDGFVGDFSLATLIDSSGFSLSWTEQNSTTEGQDLKIKTFDSGGISDNVITVINTTTLGDQNHVSTAALVGDRVIAVYQDDSGGDQDIRAEILDTRTAGQVIIGDDLGTRARADVLVGTIGDDILDSQLSDDLLYGALGDDRLIGGAGNDILSGGGNTAIGDVAVYTGQLSDYNITFLGADFFLVEDLRPGSPDGTDTLQGIEFLEFSNGAGGTVQIDITDFIPVNGITPTAWGLTDNDPDSAPDPDGTPDVDGLIVNHAPQSLIGNQTNPFIADSIGEFIGVAWQTPGADGNTHIQGQFYDVVMGFDEFMPNVVNLSDGVGIESNAVLVSGGANSGWGLAFEQLDDATDTTHEIRTNFQGPGFLTGPEISVFSEADGERAGVDQHDAALSGSFLDRTLDSPVGGSVLPTGMSDGYNVAWVSTQLDNAADDVLGDGTYGRIMFQRFEVPLDALGNPSAPVAGGVDGIAGLDNSFGTGDAAVWIGDEAGTGAGGAIGRNPSTAGTHGFETAVIWIEQDGAGGEKVAGQFYDDLGQVIPVPGSDNISGDFGVAAGTTAHVVQAGAVNLGVVWVTSNANVPGAIDPNGFTVMGTMYAPTGAGLNGVGFGFAAPAPFVLGELPLGVDPAHLDFHASGISGEDSNDVIVSWTVTTATGGAEVMAQHIAVALDPVTGLVLSMAPEGDQVIVNADPTGEQRNGGVAGLLNDRFVSVWQDTGAAFDNGSDIVARVMDTREVRPPTAEELAADPSLQARIDAGEIVLIGQTIIGDLIRNGDVQARRDVLVGTNGDDIIRGDINDAGGLVDAIWGGMGNDTIFGGGGLRGAAGIPEMIDGGEGFDTAVYSGRFTDYSITINGDGSYEVIDLRPVQDANGNPLPHDGIDNLFGIEQFHFLDSSNGGAQEQFITFGFPGTPPPLNQINGVDQGVYNGTPVAWSLDDTSQYKEITVDVGGDKSGISVTNLQDGAALTWVSAGNEVWAISYDTTGKPDPVLLDVNTELTDGTFAGNTVSDIDVAMTAGLGFTAVWESTDGSGDSELHLRFASTNTVVAGALAPGLAGGEIVVTESQEGGAEIAVNPVIQGYEIVNVDNDTLEVGFHLGFVEENGQFDTSVGDAYGALELARYEIPVYDFDAATGALAVDANGNLVPSTPATFGTGAETAPISIGLDGLRGTADDGAAIVVTNAGLFAANDPLLGSDADHTAIQGRNISIGSLHDGQLVVTYIGTDEQVHLKIYVPTIDETGDRELNPGNLADPLDPASATDIVATGITTYSELPLPTTLTANLGAVASTTQTQYIVPQQNGSFGVFWAAQGASGVDIQGVIYSGAGTNWSPSPLLTFASALPADVHFQIAPTGVTPGGLEDGFFVSWESAGAGILGQRFDMAGNLVGDQIVVGDPDSGTPGVHSIAGIDDGLMLVGYEDSGDVSAQFLDNRESGVALIGPRTGAPADVIVGTVGDDAIDGRALDDQLFGGLGNDLITMGSGADIGFGGLGNDTIIGGTGQDQLLGEAGDDLLWGGLSGPADPQVDRDLNDGLTAAGRADLVAINPGADIISGGDGIDTISFQGEFGNFNIDLSTGVVLGDRDLDGTFILEDVIGAIVDDGAGGTIFQFTNDVENATGGIGDDTIIGTDGNNVLDGQGGNNIIDGLGGIDTVIINGNRADFLASFDAATNTFTIVNQLDGTTQIVSNAEFFTFADGTISALDLLPAPTAINDTASTLEEAPVSIDVLANDTQGEQLTITAINGTSIAPGGTVDVLDGSVTLDAATSQLVFTPNTDFFGVASFAYTAIDGLGGFTTATVDITVTNVNDNPTDIVFNDDPAVTSVTVAEGAATGTVVASLSSVDPDNTATVTNDTFTYTLADNFDGRFQIVGNEIQVLNGALLDFEDPLNNQFTLNVTTNDGHGGVFSEDVVVNVGPVNEAPINATLSNATFAETLATGSVIGTLSATDPEGGAVKFALAAGGDAGGRFQIVNGNQLAVAENLLIDHRPDGDGNHPYDITVEAVDADGGASQFTFTVTSTGVAETRITGGAGQDNLNGTGGNDYIDGGANKDTMAGGNGNDVYIVDNSGDKVNENGNGGVDTIYTTLNSADLGKYANVENLVYSGNGSINAKANANLASTLIGGSNGDVLQGNNQNDTLKGLAGNDTILGNGGNDTIIGGAGNDIMSGGNGADHFVFDAHSGADIITDFNANGQDIIDLASVLFEDINDVLGSLEQVGQDVILHIDDVGGDSITLQRVTLANLDASDFHLF